MKTKYDIVAYFADFTRTIVEIKVENMADAMALARGMFCTTDTTRVTLIHRELGCLAEYKRT